MSCSPTLRPDSFAHHSLHSAPEQARTDGLESILKVSTIYDIPTGRKYAIEQLALRLGNMRPSRALYLSCKYHVAPWFERSFWLIASVPLSRMDAFDLDILERALLSHIITVRAEVDAHRRRLLRRAPDFCQNASLVTRQTGCLAPETCASSLRRQWDEEGRPMILSDFWYPLEAITLQLKSLVNAGPSCSRCTMALTALLTKSADLREEHDIITRHCMKAYNSQPFNHNLDSSEDDGMDTDSLTGHESE